MNNTSRKSAGFTLIETIIVVALFALLSGLLVEIFITYSRFFASHDSYLDVIGSAEIVMNEVESGVLHADKVLTSHAFASGTYSTGTSTLVVELPSITAGGDIVPGVYDYIAIYATGTFAYRLLDAGGGSARTGGTRTLSDTLKTLIFTYNASSTSAITSVRTDVSTEAETRDGVVGTSLHQQVYLRNK